VLFGVGDGTFDVGGIYEIGGNPAFVAIGDLNADSHADLAVASPYGGGYMSILLNLGDGSFTAPTPYPAGERPRTVAIGDFDGDDHPDLAVGGNWTDQITILHNFGNGTFTTAGSFSATYSPASVAAGDLDGDGDYDLVVASNDGSLPRDGGPSVDDGAVSVLLNDGDGSFAPAVSYFAGTYPIFVSIGDLDGDDDADLAIADAGGHSDRGGVSVLLNQGDGTFADIIMLGAGYRPHSVAIADVDNDGDPDLAAANRDSQTVSIITNDGCGSPCPADLDGSRDVEVSDLLALLGEWGACAEPCPADLDDDGTVNVGDLLILLGAWGPCA
jgi:hypothetical protein